MKRMLFNATHAEELRVAIVDGQKLVDLDIESAIRSEKKGNIYKAVVTKVEPSLEACFVDYGADKHGFLPLKEIYRSYFANYDSKTSISNIKIESVIKEGQEMLVQVDKDERGTKGAALTTFVSLAGRFLVLMPNNPKGGGISRRISGEERAELKQALDGLEVSREHALIARTAGIGRTQEELQWDLDFLLKLWETISGASEELKAPYLVYQESNLIVRSIRDHLATDISEIIIDDDEIFERARRFMTQVMPHNISKLKHYKDNVPLFSRYQIEHQIESAFNREVNLPSGGSLVIDHTEALISIDVNSARATKGSDIEETALQTNLEAADEVARQLRIRDLGGLVVIDLIDMTVGRNQRLVESRLKDALKPDRARVQIGQISRFGLLEMSRQRLRSSISDANYHSCPRCDGMGTIRSVVSSALNLLRVIEEEALKENTEAIQAILPLDIATYLTNEKRHELTQLEARLASRVIIIPSAELLNPHYQINRLRSEELDQLSGIASYKQKAETDTPKEDVMKHLKSAKAEKPKIRLDEITHSAPPARAKAKPVETVKPDSGKSLWAKLKAFLFRESSTDTKKAKTSKHRNHTGNGRNSQSSGQGNNNNQRNQNNNRGRNRNRSGQQQRRGGQQSNQANTNQNRPQGQNSNRQQGQNSKGTQQPSSNANRNQPQRSNQSVSKDSPQGENQGNNSSRKPNPPKRSRQVSELSSMNNNRPVKQPDNHTAASPDKAPQSQSANSQNRNSDNNQPRPPSNKEQVNTRPPRRPRNSNSGADTGQKSAQNKPESSNVNGNERARETSSNSQNPSQPDNIGNLKN
ncbi:MAG: Rne/Rng family ribonuclease [Gammaproteobacteria bacterium]|nr:Rne/Rng family ribonuclease [Gammaproteobacteria bacterium]